MTALPHNHTPARDLLPARQGNAAPAAPPTGSPNPSGPVGATPSDAELARRFGTHTYTTLRQLERARKHGE